MTLVMVTVGKEIRDGDGVVSYYGIAAETLCYQKPVQIGSDCKSDRGPACVCNTGQICYARETHEKPAAHIRCFRTHCGNDRSELTASEIKVAYVLCLL